MKKLIVAATLAALALGLAGCGENLEQRKENKAACEAAGGVYEEYVNGFDYTYRDWNCDLTTKTGEEER